MANTLSSWKEIAGHFGRSVRTVQRWEAQEGLPVRRVMGGVYADVAELDAWWQRLGSHFATETEPEERAHSSAPPDPSSSPPSRRPHRALAILAAVALASGILELTASWSYRPDDARTPLVRLAVLPFENLTGDDSQQYLSDGFSEEVISTLGGLGPQVAVITRALTPSQARGAGLQGGTRGLGADYLVEGSVRRQGDRLRVSVNLARVRDETYVWTRTYERDLQHLFEVQADIAEAVASELRLTHPLVATGLGMPVPARMSEARDAYLRGRYFWKARTADGFAKAIESFNQALQQDPSDDLSYVGLADSYNVMATHWLLPPSEALVRARAATTSAIRLNSHRAQAHAAAGYSLDVLEWKFDDAVRAFERAIQLNPSYGSARQWYGSLLKRLGRFEAARVELERAAALDPDAAAPQIELGDYWWNVGHPERGLPYFRRALELSPDCVRGHLLLGAMMLETGSPEEGLDQIRSAYTLSKGHPGNAAFLVYALARTGRRAEAEALWRRSEPKQGLWFSRAVVATELGAPDDAFSLLERGVEEHDVNLCVLAVTPFLGRLRSDPRLPELLERIGLPLVTAR